MEQVLLLDPAIARWVLIPITICMLLVGLARHYLVTLINSPNKPLARGALREQRALMRGQLLRSNGRHLTRSDFEARREWLMNAYKNATYLSKPKPSADGTSEPETPPNPLDPAAMEGMIGMLKKQAVMFIPQSILMGWINLFFSGFVLSESQSGFARFPCRLC